MKKVNDSNCFSENRKRMTLKDYYLNLPNSKHPKTDFLNEITSRTGVSFNTARNWVRYGMKPNNHEHISVLSEITGIPTKDLWND